MSREPAPVALHVVRPHRAPTRLQRTRALARAFHKLDTAEAALRAARDDLDAVFLPWAADRSISRDHAREQLVSTGLLPAKARG